MRDPSWDDLWYKIVSIRLDPSRDWSYNFMILQLLFLLDASSDEWVVFEIMVLVEKNLLNLVENWKKNCVHSIGKKPP